MTRNDLPTDSTFRYLAAHVANLIEPFERMWPYFWLKAAAVRDGSTWYLLHFCLVGRWSDVEPLTPMRDRGSALLAVSHLLDAAKARDLLRMMATEGRISLDTDVIAEIPECTLSNTAYSWQEPLQYISHDIMDVVEPAQWVYFYASTRSQQWLNDLQTEARIRQAIQADLERRGVHDFAHYVATRFAQGQQSANQFALNQFSYTIELPLAIRVEREQRDSMATNLTLSFQCRKPVRVHDLDVTLGKHWSSDAPSMQTTIETDSDEGWSFAHCTVPVDCGGICISAAALENCLSYEIPRPSPEEQALDAAHYMYAKSAHEPLTAGEKRWREDLQRTDENKSGARFEIALANALARLGIPVLFGGQVEQDGQLSGHATPGLDLVALDLKSRSAVAISLKSKQKAPSSDEIEKLLNAVEGLASNLTGWTTFGILACLAPVNHLSSFKDRTDIRVWSKEDVEFISNADGADAIRYLLWLPPWIAMKDSWAYFSGYIGLVNNPYFQPI